MTQVSSSGGALAPFATPVSKGKAKATAEPSKKIAVSKAADVMPTASAAAATQVSFGSQALHALAATGEFLGQALMTGVEDVGEAAYYTAKAAGTGLMDVGEGLGAAVVDGVKGVINGAEDTVTAVGRGIMHVENATGDVWSMATQGANAATNLATSLGTDVQTVATDVSTAATDLGVSANAVLSGVGSIASTAANYGTYVAKQGRNVLNELT